MPCTQHTPREFRNFLIFHCAMMTRHEPNSYLVELDAVLTPAFAPPSRISRHLLPCDDCRIRARASRGATRSAACFTPAPAELE